MKKLSILCLIITCILLPGCSKENINVSNLNDKYYGKSDFVELDKKILEELISNKETFGIFIYQPMCAASINFEKVLIEFAELHKTSFYKLSSQNIKGTSLENIIEYYPSFAIYQNGELSDYLDANSDEDTNFYSNSTDFKKWFTKYINLKDNDIKEDK